mmetsp:Transcript_9158/g.23317  ORF Transcript_9158/g.23317 Transcript_9158/m.23317 type:complete len:207 (+) Transcript_9158:467-1087(+)
MTTTPRKTLASRSARPSTRRLARGRASRDGATPFAPWTKLSRAPSWISRAARGRWCSCSSAASGSATSPPRCSPTSSSRSSRLRASPSMSSASPATTTTTVPRARSRRLRWPCGWPSATTLAPACRALRAFWHKGPLTHSMSMGPGGCRWRLKHAAGRSRRAGFFFPSLRSARVCAQARAGPPRSCARDHVVRGQRHAGHENRPKA